MEISGYKIERTIGEGGMATAYLAVQESLGRLAVLKVLNNGSRDTKENIERFLNEGRIVASLNHPHIITIYDIGIVEDFMYISMEYIEGGDLKERLKQPITAAEAIDIIKKICSALDVAHRKGVVHRDVKPANILFKTNGEPLLTDFGIAKRLTMEQDLTMTGVFLGSPNYMAPEQAENGSIDGRADIYALGVILYEMLAGKKPYQSESVIDVIVQHKQAPVPILPGKHRVYQPLLNMMMAKNRKNRFRDANSVLHFIHHLEQQESEKDLVGVGGSKAKKMPPDEHFTSHLQNPIKKRKWSTYILMGLLLLTGSGFTFVSYMNSKLNAEITSLNTIQAEVANLDSMVRLAPIPVSGSKPLKVSRPGEIEEVSKALGWLARKSLEEYRLTAPAKDNAYYYYVRLLEINPNNKSARQGLRLIADRFAFLAEKELAENNYKSAAGYIDIGLQINPNHKTLKQLKELTTTSQRNLFDSIKTFFSS